MNKKILVVGGYGQVVGKISNMLISKGNPIIVASRSIKKSERFAMKTPNLATGKNNSLLTATIATVAAKQVRLKKVNSSVVYIEEFIVMEDLEKRLQKCSQFHIYSDAKSTI